MSRIPRQSHRSPATLIPLDSRPLSKPLAPKLRIDRQRKQRRAKRLSMDLSKAIPRAPDFLRRIQAVVANLAAERDGRRPGPSFRSLAVGRDVDCGVP